MARGRWVCVGRGHGATCRLEHPRRCEKVYPEQENLLSEPTFEPVTNVADAEDHHGEEAPWGATWKCLTPHMRGAGGSLGVSYNTLGPGRIGGLFHWHLREDEVFYVLSGRGAPVR